MINKETIDDNLDDFNQDIDSTRFGIGGMVGHPCYDDEDNDGDDQTCQDVVIVEMGNSKSNQSSRRRRRKRQKISDDDDNNNDKDDDDDDDDEETDKTYNEDMSDVDAILDSDDDIDFIPKKSSGSGIQFVVTIWH
jgi:hypothetical protein